MTTSDTIFKYGVANASGGDTIGAGVNTVAIEVPSGYTPIGASIVVCDESGVPFTNDDLATLVGFAITASYNGATAERKDGESGSGSWYYSNGVCVGQYWVVQFVWGAECPAFQVDLYAVCCIDTPGTVPG